ncbi:MAG: PEP-CTERM sorting domain-containing protein [Planctomycetes bacterium]|nr:PEP-CTERM sorting domain-containing protein [Planctomycetota bacterium]
MKHLIRLVLVLALFAGVACADYMYVVPGPGPQLVTVGEIVDYSVYWHTDLVNPTINGYDILMSYDTTELALLNPIGAQIPGLGDGLGYPPPFNAFYNPVLYDAGPGLVNAALLLTTDLPLTGNNWLLAKLSFEVLVEKPWDELADFSKLDDNLGNYGPGIYLGIVGGLPQYEQVKTPQADGSDVGTDIPEPTTTALLGIGLLGALLRKRS